MSRQRSGLYWFVLTLLLAGCQAAQVARDGQNFRLALLDMYTDQAIDNLIRARCNLPFVQLSYRDLLVQDEDTYAGTAHAEQSVDKLSGLVVDKFLRDIKNTLLFEGQAKRDKILSFHADPITGQNDIYEAYLVFASDPRLLVVSDTPPRCPVHVKKKFCGKYYWVPVEAGPAFLDLVLKTAFLRGEPPAPPAAYEVQVTSVTDVKATGKDDSVNATLHFDQDVPNGTATLVTKLDGRTIRLRLRPIFEREDDPDKTISLGDPTKRLRAGPWSPKLHGFGPDDLQQKKVRLYSHDYPPEARTPAPLIQHIYDDVDRIRATQPSGRR